VDGNGTIGCRDNFECPKCDNQWRDPLQAAQHSSLQLVANVAVFHALKLIGKNGVGYERPSLQNLAMVKRWGKFKHNLQTIMFLKPCPNCGVLISKNGGCPHIKCTKC